MQFLYPLLAESRMNSIFGTLAWAFLIAALLWLLIWRLLRSMNTQSAATSLDDSAAEKAAADKAAADKAAADKAAADKAAADKAAADKAAADKAAADKAAADKAAADKAAADKAAADKAAADKAAADKAAADKAAAASSTTDDNELPEIETVTAEQAAEQFRPELDAGVVRQDNYYGIVFHAAPDDPDDLKKIKGVAKVLEGKLNEFGVFKYRQIAFWTDPAAKEFSKLLTNFKDRIYRDNWIAQAKELHEEKYGEKL